MGLCCSCFEGNQSSGQSSETEMQSTRMARQAAAESKALVVSPTMSSSSVEVTNGIKVSGSGLALVGVAVEQDAAYWEIHVSTPSESEELMIGVASKKDDAFYSARAQGTDDSPEANGTNLMSKIKIKDGDIVGVAVQQSDLPMVQFLLNGEPMHDLSVNRFRGTAYPAIYLFEKNQGLSATFIFNESDFKELSPHVRFGPLILARGLL